MQETFYISLLMQLQDFNLEQALQLSNEMHHHECTDGFISPREDALWLKLTCMIEKERTGACSVFYED